jgi:hypothetical protein
MTISAEQRQVLLDRLAKAREAKDLKKASAPPKEPKAKTAKKTKAPEQSSLPSPTPAIAPSQPEAENVNVNVSITEKPIASPPSTPSLPIPIPPSKSRKEKPVAEGDESDGEDARLSQKQKAQKKAYAKVVFYQQPSAKKMDKMMKQLAHETSESESESEDEAPAPPVRQRQQSPPPVAYSTIAPQRQPVRRQQPYNIQTQSQQRTDYLRQLALAYYS